MSDIIIAAAWFAGLKHRDQKRKYTNRPYIEHPMRVAGMASLNYMATPELVAAAWLHDVVEDCGVSLQTIQESFGFGVARYVEMLTNTSKINFPDANRRERKRIDRERIKYLPRDAKMVKLIDRIDNVREMGQAPADFRMVYGQESTLLLSEALCDVDDWLETELLFCIQELEVKQ